MLDNRTNCLVIINIVSLAESLFHESYFICNINLKTRNRLNAYEENKEPMTSSDSH